MSNLFQCKIALLDYYLWSMKILEGPCWVRLRLKGASGFTFRDALALIATVVLVWFLFRPAIVRPRPHPRTQCIANLKEIGKAFQSFANDHGDAFPMEVSVKEGGTLEFGRPYPQSFDPPVFRHFRSLSNYLASPAMLTCPMDVRKPVTNWSGLTANLNVGYFVGWGFKAKDDTSGFLAGDRNLTNKVGITNGVLPWRLFLGKRPSVGWNGPPHGHRGHVLIADGGVLSLSNGDMRLDEMSIYPTNEYWLLLPLITSQGR